MAHKTKQRNLQSKTIVLEIEEGIYNSFMEQTVIAHEILSYQIAIHPELFPIGIADGYMLKGAIHFVAK